MKCSFDFDKTLSFEDVQDFASELIQKGVEVWIVTARFDYDNKDVFEVAERLKISKEHIVFTNMYLKSEYFEKNEDFIWHLDDDSVELEFINKDTKVKAINVKNESCKRECLNLLKL